MPERDLATLVRSLTPGALRLFRQQLASLPDRDKQVAFSRLSGVTELEDIIGRPALEPTQKLKREQPEPQTTQQKVPLWAKGLQAVGAPFDWIGEHITEPFGAVVTSPFTPELPGGRQPGESSLAYERRQYEQWEEPTWTTPWGGKFRPTKGIVETLPWLALPTAGGVLGKLGMVAAKGGQLGAAAGVAAKVVRPLAAAEAIPGRVVGAGLGKITPKAEPLAGFTPESLTRLNTLADIPNELANRVTVIGSVAKGTARQASDTDLIIELATKEWAGLEKGALGLDEAPPVLKYIWGKFDPDTMEQLMTYVYKRGSPNTLFEYRPRMVKAGVHYSGVLMPTKLDPIRLRQNRMPLNALVGAGLGKITPKMGKVPSAIWADLSKPQRMTLANGAGITHRVDWKAWNGIAPEEQKLLVDQMAKLGADPSKYRIVSSSFPEGFSSEQQSSVLKYLGVIQEAKPLRRTTERLYTKERGKRFRAAGEALETGRGEEAFRQAKSRLVGEYPTATGRQQYEAVRDLMTPDDINNLLDIIRVSKLSKSPELNAIYRVDASDAFQKTILGQIPQINELKKLEAIFGSDLVKAILEKRGRGEKAREFLLELANAPRALLASGDASYLLRQGAMGLAGYPRVGIKTFAPSIEATFSSKFAGELDDIIRSLPHTDSAIEHKLAITPLPGRNLAAPLAEREEAFISGLFRKLGEFIPAFKKVDFVTASNRGYVSGLNNLRSSIWEQVLTTAEAAGRKITDLDLDELAGFINAITGRGDLHFEALKRADSLLNAIFFAPKLIASRIQVFKYLWSPSELARREAWRTLPRFFGVGIAMLSAAKLSGAAEVELDPRSADFGKLKVGDNRLDIWTGYSQYARFLAQLAVAQRKTEGGRVVKLNRGDVMLRFGQTKLSPAMGFFADLANGETYLGEDFPPKSVKSFGGQVWERFAPLAIQDIIQGVEADGFTGGFQATPGLFGVGIATYTDEVKRARDKVAQKEFGVSWDEVGTKYGRAEQLKLEQTPTIIEAEKEHEDRFAGGTPTSMDNFRNEGKLIEETYREGVDNAVREYRERKDGKLFREKITKVSENRRAAYSLRAKKAEYQDIIAYYNQPIPPDKLAEMNPGDVVRREYYQQMFDPIKMYDEFGNYRFDEADKIEREFVVQYGQQAMDYIEEYQGARWLDKPVELRMLEEAKELLRPYWDVAGKIWAMYPEGLQEISDQIQVMENGTDEEQRLAKVQLRKYPMILRARELIAQYKKQMRQYNPEINQAYKIFY